MMMSTSAGLTFSRRSSRKKTFMASVSRKNTSVTKSSSRKWSVNWRRIIHYSSSFIIHTSYFSVASVRRSIQRLQVLEPLASVSGERELLGLGQDGERPRALSPDEIDLREPSHGVLLAGKHLQDGEKASLGFGIFLLVRIGHSFKHVRRGIVPVFFDELLGEEKRLVILGQKEMRERESQSVFFLQSPAP